MDSFYIESTLPEHVTIAEYRRSRPRKPSFWQRLKELAGGGAAFSPATSQ